MSDVVCIVYIMFLAVRCLAAAKDICLIPRVHWLESQVVCRLLEYKHAQKKLRIDSSHQPTRSPQATVPGTTMHVIATLV